MKQPHHNHSSPKRRGTTVIEMVATLGLLSALLGIILPFFASLATARQVAADRELALHEIRNLAELVRSGENVEDLKLSETTAEYLEQPELIFEAETIDDQQMQQIRIQLSWINHANQRMQPVELSVWITAEDNE